MSSPDVDAAGRLNDTAVADALRAHVIVTWHCRWCERRIRVSKRDALVCPLCDRHNPPKEPS